MKDENKHNTKTYIYMCVIIFAFFVLTLSEIITQKNKDNYNKEIPITNLCDKIDDVISVNIPKKRYFVKLDNKITKLFVNMLKSNIVIIGENDWLFYNVTGEELNSLADYQGTSFYTQEDIKMAYDNLKPLQDYCDKKNVKFSVVVPPNKENVYSQYMPKIYNRSTTSRTDILLEKLKEKGIKTYNLKDQMLKYKDSYEIYFPHDTHWNTLGGYIGAQYILNDWGILLPPLNEVHFIENEFGSNDLAVMLNMTDSYPKGNNYFIEYEIPTNETVKEKFSNETFFFNNSNAPLKKNVLLVGDSFRYYLSDALRNQFENVFMVYREEMNTDFNQMRDWIEKYQIDYVILEYVERYSYKMKTKY